jgi:cytochrome c oxidase subunit 2
MAINRFEKAWLIAVFTMMGAFIAALMVGVLVFNVRLPQPVERINPQNIANTDFAKLGVRKVGGNRVDVYMIAKMWAFDAGAESGAPGTPPKIRIPVGSNVTFNVASLDILHGFYIEEHAANLELVPGQVARISARFNRPGTFKIICNQYCGAGHQVMYGEIIVE